MIFNFTKTIISGYKVEIYRTEKHIRYGFAGRGGRPRKKNNNQTIDYRVRKQTVRKARQQFSRLYNANFGPNFNAHNNFITLTFRDGSLSSPNDIALANNLFKKFIQRLRYHLRAEDDFKYIAIIDFQDQFGREAIHYHLVTNSSPIPQDTLAKIWRYGFVWIGRIRNFMRVENYLTKHLRSNMLDERLYGKKLYLPSPNLDKPVTLIEKPAEDLAQSIESREKEVYSYEYISDYHGKTQYKIYNLSNAFNKGYIWKDMIRYFNRVAEDIKNSLSLSMHKGRLHAYQGFFMASSRPPVSFKISGKNSTLIH